MKQNTKQKNPAKKLWQAGLILLATILLAAGLCSCKKSAGNDTADVFYPETGSGIESSLSDRTPDLEPKIVKTANLTAQTTDYDESVKYVRQAVSECGGYIETSEVSGKSVSNRGNYGYRSATYTLRIPAEKLDDFLSLAEEAFNVTSLSTTDTDITVQYYDAASRLEVLKTERDALETMLESSKNVDQMLQIEKRLYQVIQEIESYQSQIRIYDSKASYSTVNLSLSEVSDLTPAAAPGFGERVKNAFSDMWSGFTGFCKDAAIWLIYAMPVLIVLAAVAVCIVTIVNRNRRKKKTAQNQNTTGEPKL